MLRAMNIILKYRSRVVTDADAAFIRELIADHPTLSRRALSKKLCEAWNWVQPNGHPRDMVCRGLMLALHRAGHIELPAQRQASHNPLAERCRPAAVKIDARSQGRPFTPRTFSRIASTRAGTPWVSQ